MQWKRSAFCAIGQRGAFDELHYHHKLVFGLKRGVKFGDVWMVEPRERANLAQKPIS
jgi:hypothetical protein